MRFLGFDYGARRIGLAFGETTVGIASPVGMVEVRGDIDSQTAAIRPFIEEYHPDELVVGLPLNMDGSEGPQARRTRAFAEALSRRLGKPVRYWDERLSSFAADGLLNEAELTRKKRKCRHDAVAAQIILQGFLDAHRAATRES